MSTQAITSKARVKDRLGITSTAFDTVLDRLILATTARIEAMCNRKFMQATYTNELYDGASISGARGSILIVKNAPILSISSVQYKTGLNSNPTWYSYDADDYDVDLTAGLLYFGRLPAGRQNIRLTYTAGYSGFNVGITTVWVFNATPSGTVDGTNRTFTLPVNASQVVVYADGVRISSSNYAFTADTDTITFNAGYQPVTTISVDYLPSDDVASEDDPALPLEVVEVCEEVVVRLFKKRDSEGRSSETFRESQVTWNENVFTKENIATIKNYRRGTFL